MIGASHFHDLAFGSGYYYGRSKEMAAFRVSASAFYRKAYCSDLGTSSLPPSWKERLERRPALHLGVTGGTI